MLQQEKCQFAADFAAKSAANLVCLVQNLLHIGLFYQQKIDLLETLKKTYYTLYKITFTHFP